MKSHIMYSMKLTPSIKRGATTLNIYLQSSLFILTLGMVTGCGSSTDEIKRPDNAPKPLSPTESIKSFKLPPGFRIELVASEPLISEPTTEYTFLGKDIKHFTSSETSLMPTYVQALNPQDCANIIAWLRESLAVN